MNELMKDVLLFSEHSDVMEFGKCKKEYGFYF